MDGPYSTRYKKDLFFGMVKIGKAYVSYHLIAIYVYPELLNGLSPELKKRMQGKSCFNFTSIDEELMEELEDLTRHCLARHLQISPGDSI